MSLTFRHGFWTAVVLNAPEDLEAHISYITGPNAKWEFILAAAMIPIGEI